jgi:hypothetical protein
MGVMFWDGILVCQSLVTQTTFFGGTKPSVHHKKHSIVLDSIAVIRQSRRTYRLFVKTYMFLEREKIVLFGAYTCSKNLAHEKEGTYPVVTGQQNQVLGGTGLADSSDSSLDGGGPGVDVLKIVGLVHETESDLGLRSVLGSKLRPHRGELSVGGTTAAANNLAVPAGVVVEVEDTELSTGVQAVGHLLIVLGEEGGVEVTAELAVDKVLPANGETESVELVVLDEVLHLGLTGGSRVDVAAGGSTVGVHAEIEASNVDTGVLVSLLFFDLLS